MAIKITLPSIGSGSSKDSIVSILASEWPLSAQEIYNRLKKAFGGGISYQAVHKTLKALVEENVVEKVGKDYRLNKDWISNLKRFSDSLVVEYENKSPKIDFEHFRPIHLAFENFFDAGKFLIHDYYGTFPNPDRKEAVCFWQHAYPSVGLSKVEFEAVKKIFEDAIHYSISKGKTLMDKQFSKDLASLGKRCVVGVEFSPPTDTFVQGDYILQLIFPVELKSKIDEMFASLSSHDQINLMDYLEKILAAKYNIHGVIFKNSELAERFRQEAIAIYKDPKSERVE